MSLTFYFSPMSTAEITHLVLEELGVPHEVVKVDLRAGDTKKPEFLKLNPNGKVPCIVHEGTPIWESAAITMYLGETFGVQKGLYPAAGPKRGEASKWIVWANVTLGAAVNRWALNTLEWTPADQHNAKAAEAGMAEIKKCLEILDHALAGKAHLLGDYTLVDAHVSSLMGWLHHMKIDMTGLSNIAAWEKRCGERPAHKKVMAG